jgi:hypothetical protein
MHGRCSNPETLEIYVVPGCNSLMVRHPNRSSSVQLASSRLLARSALSAGSCLLALLVFARTASADAGHNVDTAHGAGIWKAVVPPTAMSGEFDSLDPIGVAAGARIKADCSLNWINPDDGRRYCFSSGTSLEFFLDEPQANLARARAGWRKLTATQ